MTTGLRSAIVVAVSSDTARTLGPWLRERREEMGIDLQQAQADTRIRARYLEALESGEYEALPDLVVGRGFAKSYAAYLGLDVEETARLYSTRVTPHQPVVVSSDESNPFAGRFEPVPLHEMPGRGRRWLWLLPVLLLVAGLVALGWWQYPRIAPWLSSIVARREKATVVVKATQTTLPEATPTPAITAATKATSTPTLRAPTLTMTPTLRPSATPTTTIYTGIFLELVFTDTSWVQITVDGVREFQGELTAGTYKSWFGEQSIELRVGNAGAVSVTLNGEKLGTLGDPGDVIERVFEKVGDTVTAGTPSPAGTETPSPAASPTPTIEPSATPSPEQSPTP